MGLRYVVLTSVDRDDLPDGGAAHFAAVVRAVRVALPGAGIEVLTPDFKGDRGALGTVLASGPEVFNHNIETVPRLFERLRPQGRYGLSLEVLAAAKALRPGQATKSGLMVGLGETDDEVVAVLHDLRAQGVDIVTIGQYLRPSRGHEPVHRYVAPAAFEALEAEARAIGFPTVYAGVFVRSSFNAEEVYRGGGAP
jgi:lipoic acid synthetase